MPDGTVLPCATRRVLKTLATEQRHVVAAGDWVYFRKENEHEGVIERVEPRQGILSRMSKGRQHIMVANVDQLLVLGSAAEPYLKPNLIDRFLVSAEQAGLRPIIGINKIDLVDPAELQPLVGVYARMGYPIFLMSIQQQRGLDQVRELLTDRATVIVGQSGVGKSSFLNAIDPTLQLRTGNVSNENQKGRHTTTTARLLKLASGGYVVDTPGIRQFQLWDIVPAEVAGRFRDMRPYVNLCHYPNCTHTHESGCAIKDGVADGYLDARRYESLCSLQESEELNTDDWE
jgi:ribosome biogenesis GTPase